MSAVLTKPAGFDRRTRYEVVRSSIDRPCDDYPYSSVTNIRKGELYLLCTEFPGGESGFADSAGHPVRLRICMACAPRWAVEQLVPEPRDSGSSR